MDLAKTHVFNFIIFMQFSHAIAQLALYHDEHIGWRLMDLHQ